MYSMKQREVLKLLDEDAYGMAIEADVKERKVTVILKGREIKTFSMSQFDGLTKYEICRSIRKALKEPADKGKVKK